MTGAAGRTGSAGPALPAGRAPVQARARASQDRILDAAAGLLAERGVAGCTMTDVAERAEVSIGSVYRWFPAQNALVHELALRHLAHGQQAALEAVDGEGGPVERLERALRAYLASAADPLVVEIMRAIRQDPALRAVDRSDTATNAALLAEVVGLPPERVDAVALVIDLAGHLIVDLAERSPRQRRSMVDTFVEMARAAVDPPA